MGLCHPRGPPLPYLKGNRSCQPPPLFSGANIQFTILASITNRELLGRLGLHTMDTYLARRQLQWLGHVTPCPQKGTKKTYENFFIAFELSIKKFS
jgi:hypothetical protein